MGLFKRNPKNNNATSLNATPLNAVNKDGTDGESLHTSFPGLPAADGGTKGLDAVYAFLQYDYESRGYNDALTNPDESYKADNIKLFHHDLMILLDRTAVYYDGLLKQLDFHMSSRSRAGLIDLVEELKIRKEQALDHITRLKALKEEAVAGSGVTQRIALSYQRGFMRGLSAISQSKLFNNGI